MLNRLLEEKSRMSNFIDIHNHILPQVDDGSKSIDQSMNMMRIAYREGIRCVISTPHFFVGRYEHSTETILEAYNILRKRAEKEMPDMTIYLGNEIMFTSDISDIMENNKIFTMADSMYVLVEFFPSTPYNAIKDGIREVAMAGKIPIIAHVERYESIMDDIYCIDELKELGACIQVNCGSVTGNMGRTIKKNIRKLMKEDMVDFVATDSHSDGHRAPYMSECARYIAKKFDEDYMERLLIHNPQKIIDNKYL